MALGVERFIVDFSEALKAVDARMPQAINARSKVAFQPGIGPHSEAETVRLVMSELATSSRDTYREYSLGVPYPSDPRQKCDLCIGTPPHWGLVVEAKLLRLLGDNGKPNDNMLMHILSPYPQHRSALTDCEKLVSRGPIGTRAIVIFGYDNDEFPMDIAIQAFEVLATQRVTLAERHSSAFDGLVHPVHKRGMVVGWKVSSETSAQP